MFFAALYIFLIIQRVLELLWARRNERIVKAKGAVEFDRNGYKNVVFLHVLFFISLLFEKIFFHRELNQLWYIFLIIFILAQLLRYWAIYSLGFYWNTKVLVIPGAKIVNRGPYKFVNHPNYLAVIIEIAVIPVIFSCYYTSLFFTILNILILKRRIKIEETALKKGIVI